jgi:hypothetical protein
MDWIYHPFHSRISLGNANRPFAVHAAATPTMTHVKEVSMGKVFADQSLSLLNRQIGPKVAERK